MSLVLAFDCETTGKADFSRSPEAEQQPRMVQLAAILLDEEWREVGILSAVFSPSVPISDEVAKIHGITQEKAQKCGIAETAPLAVFDSWLKLADIAVAHNFDFDVFMLSRNSPGRRAKLISKGFCTMKAMAPVCKLPGQYDDYKWPKLSEAWKYCFPRARLPNMHDALGDARACAAVYRWLQSEKPARA